MDFFDLCNNWVYGMENSFYRASEVGSEKIEPV